MRKCLIIFFFSNILISASSDKNLANKGETYRNQRTENLFHSLKILSDKGFTMFGMANAYTINYVECIHGEQIENSDLKDICGDNPAFVESDFMWYANLEFRKRDLEAMQKAHKRGAILGYCWHLAGHKSNSFYVRADDRQSGDFDLASKIVSNDDRQKNKELDWYLTKLDTLVIPIFKQLDFPLVFRPFHEMTGDWFWWGRQIGADTYVKLFRLTVDYLRKAGIRNILYCWAPDKTADFSFYPGDDFVDVLGYDAYEPGLKPYITTEILLKELGKIVNYARKHGKVAAWTEVGLRSEMPELYEYPDKHPDFWTKQVWDVIKNSPTINNLAWVMTWYNADWGKDKQNPPFVPYRGMEKKGAEAALLDFAKLYNYDNSLFEKDMPDMDGGRSDQTMFILPKTPSIKCGETISLLGGSISGWFLDEPLQWESSDPSIANIDADTGIVRGISSGVTQILVKNDGRSASVKIVVLPKP